MDRITGGTAVVILSDGEREFAASLPLWALPGAREGDWLRASFEPDVGKKSETAREIDSLMDELGA